MIPILSKAQVVGADNGLSLVPVTGGTKVQLGGPLVTNTSFDLGATSTYNVRKGTANYLHILNNGNIGFGTNAPSASFDVVGASRFRNSLTLNFGTANRTTQIRDNGLYISRTLDGTYTNAITADASMSFITRGGFKFISNAIERVTFLETGNVGIGNTNPSYKLDVSGTFRGTNLVSQVPVGNVTSLKLLNQDGKMLGSFETDAGASTYLRSFFNLTIDPNTSGAGSSFVKITTLSGTGTRMVVADHNGILSTQAIPFGGGGGGLGFYTDNGTLSSNRIVNTANFSLTAQSVTSGTNATVFQVINNVGTNAIRARDDGSVRLSTSIEVDPGGLSLDNDKQIQAFSPDYSKLGVFKMKNDGLALRSNSDVFIESWANEKILVVKNGNNYVGIGTSVPTKKLHVLGSGLFEPTDVDGFTTIHAKGVVNWNKGLEYKITDADGVSNAYGLKITGYNVSGNKTIRFSLEGANEGSFTGENWNFERSVMFRGGISNGNHEDFDIRLKTNTLSPGNKAIKFYAENFGANPIMSIVQNGTVGIGTSDTKGFKFAVAGNMIAEKMVVKLASAWPDYVFEPNYKLPTLSYVEKYIQEHGHLPGVTSAKEIEEKGIDVAETQVQLLKKIEELTLYVIELKKEMDQLKKQVDSKK
jgi:hypothetical protein